MEKKKNWNRLRDKTLLDKRISELDLHINGTGIAPLIQQLYSELDAKRLSFRPPCFLADEWFCPVGVPAIGIPFYLVSSRLRRLEKKIILEAEGDTKTEFMKLIRHETGHAYSYAYELYKKKKWQRLFGLASSEYLDTYSPKPYSKSYVIHLDNWYAQSHPDEDFAETFAIWMTPKSNWRKKYKNWIAYEKLQYVDDLMNSLIAKKPAKMKHINPKEYGGLNIKLKTYYARKKKLYEEQFPNFYDNDLKTLFTNDTSKKSKLKAYRFLAQNRQKILRSVAVWTKEKRYTINELMSNLIERCKELNLYVKEGDNQINYQVVAYVTTLISNHLFTGKFKRSK